MAGRVGQILARSAQKLAKLLRLAATPQAAVVTAGFLGMGYLALTLTVMRAPQTPRRAAYRAPDRVKPEALRQSQRKVYPYSVVAGGIYERAEVGERMRTDPVVNAHYRGIDTERLVPLQLAKPRLAYVSYRRDNRVYWTKRPVKIAAGEVVWTDGKSKIRARCGNLLAENPQLPTYWMDPEERELNRPQTGLLVMPARAGVAPVASPLAGALPGVEDPSNPGFAPLEGASEWFPQAADAGPGPGTGGPTGPGAGLLPGGGSGGSGGSGGGGGSGEPGGPGTPVDPGGPGNPGTPGEPGNPGGPNPPVTPPGPNPPGPNPPGPNPPGPNPPGPNPPVTPPGPNPPGPNPPGPNPPGPTPPVTPPGPNPPGPNPPVFPPVTPPEEPPIFPPVIPPGPNPPVIPPGPNPPGPNPPGPNPPTPTPEPSTWLLMGAGLASLAYYKHRNSRGRR